MRIRRPTSGYGNARHPAEDVQVAGQGPHGPGVGSNTRLVGVAANGPSVQAVQMQQVLAAATNTASPMARGFRVWAQDAGDPTRRMTGRMDPRYVAGLNQVSGIDNAVYAIRPVLHPTAVRVNFQAGASQQPAYPGTGQATDFGSPLAWMSLNQVSSPGIG